MPAHRFTRRQFNRTLLSAAAAAAAAPLPAAFGAAAPGPAGEADFSVVVLGDTHFDKLAHHDMDWLRREKAGDVRQVENYSRITAEVLPSLLAEVKGRVEASNGKVPFVVHLGDLIEGLCGTPELARRHCEEAVEAFAPKSIGNVPLLLTKGNHDVTGPGAKEAFDQVLRPGLAHPGAERAQGANYVLRHRGAWFVAFDGYDRSSLEWLKGAIADHDPESAGPLVLLVHQPVVPYTARCWHVMGKPADAARRAGLLKLLAAHRALVLNGHLHKYGLLRRTVEGAGHFDQLSLISVISDTDPAPRDEREGAAAYGPSLTELEPKFSPDTVEDRRQTLAAERPAVTRFEYADLPGYAVLHFRGREVTAELRRGVGRDVWRTRDLRGPLAPA